MNEKKNKFHFKTNVLLKSVIGKDLINNDNIAVLELVKNSFDARSPIVKVVFKNLKENDDSENEFYSDGSSKLFIKDYGFGMDIDDIRDKWLNIAYSDKKYLREKGTIYAGAKGVGRFSCDRLGQYLDLYTKKKGSPIYHISIDWKDYEVENNKDLKIQDVEIKLEEVKGKEFQHKFGEQLKQGTFLEISKLRSQWVYKGKKNKWNTETLLDLRRYLEKLINPNQPFGGIGFTIEMIADEFKYSDDLEREPGRINGIIENKIFEKLNFTTTIIESEILPDGKKIKTTLTDKGRIVLEVEEKNVAYRLLKDIKIVIYYLNSYAKAYFKRQTGIRSVDFGSIFLFINGFRVNPLGDSGDDWLRMEVRKGQGYAKFLGTREVVGRIEINDSEENFKIISSREGVVKDERFKQIVNHSPSSYKGFFYKTFRRLEKYVVEGLEWDKTKENIKDIEKRVDSFTWKYDPSNERYVEGDSIKNDRVFGIVSSIIQVDTDPKDILNIYVNEELIEQLLFEEREKAKEKLEKFIKDYSKFGPGIIAEGTRKAIASVREELIETKKELHRKEKQLEKEKKEKEKLKEDLQEVKEKVKGLEVETLAQKNQIYFQQTHLDSSSDYTQVINLHHQVGISSNTINGHLTSFREDVEHDNYNKENLIEYITDLSFENNKIRAITDMATQARFNAASPELKEGNLTEFIIQYINEVSKTIIKTFDERKMDIHLDATQVIENYIQSFNWIEIVMIFDNLFNNSRKAKAKNIMVSINSDSNKLTISVKDDGIGVPHENRNKIFEFGFSTTYGTGLGLYHVKKILHKINGEITLNEKLEKGCEFIIEVRR